MEKFLGFLHTSAVVAGIIPLATGTAYAAKALKNGRITVCLFGDGALEEGGSRSTQPGIAMETSSALSL